MTYPKISIKYNKFLDPIFQGWITAQPQWADWKCPPIKEVQDRIKAYNDEWAKVGPKVMKGLYLATGLKFKRNTIDIHIVSGNPRPFSSPIVIKSRYTPQEFVNVLTHELIHVLCSDNDDVIPSANYRHMFNEGNDTIDEHIAIFAIMNFIFEDMVCDTSYITEESGDYKKAFDIAKERGWKEILENIKNTKK